MIINWTTGATSQDVQQGMGALNWSAHKSVYGGCWEQGQSYVGGFQEGEVHHGGFQQGEVYLPGFQEVQGACE